MISCKTHWEWLTHPTILSDRVGKPFSVRPAADMTYYVETPETGVYILSDGVSKPFAVHPAADDDLLF